MALKGSLKVCLELKPVLRDRDRHLTEVTLICKYPVQLHFKKTPDKTL